MSDIALVTGGNRGIGLQVVRQLAEGGYTVILGSRDAAKGEEAAAQLGDDRVLPRQLDVADAASVAALADRVRSEQGRLDVLVNNAAINYDRRERAVSVGLDDVRRTLETNLLGAWRVAQAFIPLLRDSGHGRIVNVSSQAGALATMDGGTPAYSSSKAALNALTRLLADELAADGILVNSVCPGWTNTDMGQGGRPAGARGRGERRLGGDAAQGRPDRRFLQGRRTDSLVGAG